MQPFMVVWPPVTQVALAWTTQLGQRGVWCKAHGAWCLGCSPPEGQSDKKINSLHIPPPHDPSK